jgi:predicted DNA-binding transcriptional regulator YafY
MAGPEEICRAIHERKLLQFNYTGDKAVGFRIVEPHQVGNSSTGKLSLSAWYRSGASESQQGPGFRIYLLSEINTLTVLDEQFSGPRQGYKPGANKIIHNVQCEL